MALSSVLYKNLCCTTLRVKYLEKTNFSCVLTFARYPMMLNVSTFLKGRGCFLKFSEWKHTL